MTGNNKVKAIAFAAIMVLSVVAMSGLGTAIDVRRGGEDPTFNPGVGGANTVVVSEQKPVVFRGEDDVSLETADGQQVNPSNLIGVSGDAEGIPLELPVPRDQTLGQYAFNGQAAREGVTVQQPRVTDLEILNERGADVAGASVPEDEVLLVRAEWNFEQAEDLELNITDANGNEITGDVLTSAEALSQAQVQELSGPYAENPSLVTNVGQRGTGTEVVYLQGLGQLNETTVGNQTPSLDATYWAIDLSDQNAGRYSITVEGWDNLDFGSASRTESLQLSTETDIILDLGQDSATRGQYVSYTVRGSTAGATHFVTIEDDDFRNDRVNERVFRDVQDTVDRGTFDANDDGNAEFAWAEVIVDEDTGVARGQIDTAFLDDTNVDVNLYEEDLNLTDVANTLNNPEDDRTLRVVQGGLTIDEPAGTYIAGQEVDVLGTAPQGVDDVALYVRDQGDWELLDVDTDGQLNEEDLISVDADGEWEERDVRLSEASDILAIPGRYRFGVIEAEDARDQNGNLRSTLTTSQFSQGTSEQTSIIVTEPGLGVVPNETNSSSLGAAATFARVGVGPQAQMEGTPGGRPLVFLSYNGQVATEDGTVDVIGTAPGLDDVLVVMIDNRGRVSTEQVTVDDDDIFEEDDIPLLTQDGRELNEGPIVGLVIGLGRDGVVGDGVLPGAPGGDAEIAELENYIQGQRTGLTQQQVVARIFDETVDEVASDDLVVRDQFRYTDGRTSIEEVAPRQQGDAQINPGDTIRVRGLTNRKPDDNTISVDIVGGPSADLFPSESDDQWNWRGRWGVTLQVPQDAEPGNYTVEADDGDNTDTVTFQVQAPSEETPTETPAPETETPTETPAPETETPTETPAPATETPTQPTASVVFEDQSSTNQQVTVAEANLSDGGYVVIHNETGAVVGSSEYLEPGISEDISIQIDLVEGTQQSRLIAMAHLDTDGNQQFDFVATNGSADGPYTADGEPVTDDAQVTFESGSIFG
jgi:hypothetical protein